MLITKNSGCNTCGYVIKHRKKNGKRNIKKEAKIFKKRMIKRKPNIEIISKYKGLKYKIKYKCKSCSHEWSSLAKSMLYNKETGCPACNIGGFQPDREAELYLYNINDTYLGFGITGVPKRRHYEHSVNLNDSDYDFKHTHSFTFKNGQTAHDVESKIKDKFVRMDSGVDGFRYESVSIDYLDAVLLLIEREMI